MSTIPANRDPFEFGHVQLGDEVVLVRYKVYGRFAALKVRTQGPKGLHLECCQERLEAVPSRIDELFSGELVMV